MTTSQRTDHGTWRDLIAVVFAMLFPTVATWMYFVALAGDPGTRPVFLMSKIVQFSFPLLWVVGTRRHAPRFGRPRIAGIGQGLAFGALVLGAATALYFGLFKHGALLADAPAAIRLKVQDLGVATPGRYFAMAAFYVLIHSALEEYYWRWFVFGQLRRWLPTGAAIALSSLAFMSHHVILVSIFFKPNWPLVAALSLGVGFGGAVWAWIYQRSGSLVGPWLSHLLIDAALMLIGYDMVFTGV